ncbi:MAG: hypothetical protein AB7F98_14265 [Novosphingobium sp.]
MPAAISRIIICAAILGLSACSGSGPQVQYVSGVPNAEDLVPIPGTRWIVAGGLDEPGKTFGRLTLIDRESRTARLLFSGESPVTSDLRDGDPKCPGPLEPGKFGAHGIGLRVDGEGRGTLYAVNHTGREAIELFALDWSGKEPTAVWTGCIPLPERVLSNGVAPLPGGAIAVTWMNAPEYFTGPNGREQAAAWIPKFVAGETTGYAAIWTAAGGWQKVPGSEGSVPNGIEASKDGRWLYVNLWGNQELRRVPVGEGKAAGVKLDFMPDNVRWGDDGKLWIAGAAGDRQAYFECSTKPGCHNDYRIASLDPATMKASELAHPDTRPDFGDATAAVGVGGEVWIGSNPTERVAWMPYGK